MQFAPLDRKFNEVSRCHQFFYVCIILQVVTVSRQNTIGIYITRLILIQPTDVKQNAVNNNWFLKLQPAVMLQSWQNFSEFHQDYEYVCHILFFLYWTFADFVA